MPSRAQFSAHASAVSQRGPEPTLHGVDGEDSEWRGRVEESITTEVLTAWQPEAMVHL